MKSFTMTAAAILAASLAAGSAEAYTSKQKATITAGPTSIAESTTFAAAVVEQGNAADPAATLGFGALGAGDNTLKDSNEAIKVTVTTNLAANRILIYTDNTATNAVPKAEIDTGTGNDAGGLVGADKTTIVPLLWSIADTNVDHVPTAGTVGDDEVFVVGAAHVRTFVEVVPGQAKNGVLDNLNVKMCDPAATPPIPVFTGGTGPDSDINDGVYAQYFGKIGQSLDVCSNSAAPVIIDGKTYNQNDKLPFAEELVKNIATVVFGCLADGKCTAPNLATPSGADSITVTSPFYLPMMGDFRTATAQTYGTNTLTVELVTQ